MPGEKKLLVVDDDPMMLDFTERAAKSLGYACVAVQGASCALSHLREDADIHVLIIDLRLGRGQTGTRLGRDALAIRPDLGVILSSGDPVSLRTAAQDMPKAVGLLPKPYRRRDLADVLDRVP